MIKIIAIAMLLTGCSAIRTEIKFTKSDVLDNAKIVGSVRARLSDVQKFRSLLESLEYRLSEKVK